MKDSPAVVQQVLREDRNVNVLPEHRTQHGSRAMDTSSQLVEEHHRDYDVIIITKNEDINIATIKFKDDLVTVYVIRSSSKMITSASLSEIIIIIIKMVASS